MYHFNEDFTRHDDDFQPYNIYVERSSNLAHLHGRVKKDGYAVSCCGNKHLFKTPALKNFNAEVIFRYSQLSFKNSVTKHPLKNPAWMCYFHYDKKSRCGAAVAFEYKAENKMIVKLLKIDGIRQKVMESQTLDNVVLEPEKEYSVNIGVKENRLRGNFENREFSFETESGLGAIGLGRFDFAGEVVFRRVYLISEDAIEQTVVIPGKTVEIPTLNGGALPYKLSFEICKINEMFRLSYEFHGGVYFREIDDNMRSGQYSVEQDRFISPYLKLLSGGRECKIYIKNGRLTILDPHIHLEFLKEYFEASKLPISGKIAIDRGFAAEHLRMVFGYEELAAEGYNVQKSGPSEFVFDINGSLLYQGPALTDSTYEVLSPADKRIIEKLPENIPEREAVVAHFQSNHYFLDDEEIKMTLRMHTKLNPHHVRVSASLNDVFDEVITDDLKVIRHISEDNFLDKYNEINYSVKTDALKLGVYRLIFYVYDGEEMIKRVNSTFEVLDSENKTAPPIASGLPFMYSTPNEERFLERDTFDPWNPMPGCDTEHYFSCTAFTPEVGIKKRIWEVLSPLNREWFMWLTNRTADNWDYRLFMDGMKNADYINYPLTESFSRPDLWKVSTYKYGLMGILQDFLADNPQIAGKLNIKADAAQFTQEDLSALENVCREEWRDYMCAKVKELTSEQNRYFSQLNPKFKRSSYGPYPLYACPCKSHHMMRNVGINPDDEISNLYKGFMQFEDYPHLCSYFSYRGAFAAMTIKLYSPGLKIYPELYSPSHGGCPDGLVAFANPPLAKCDMPFYAHSAQAYEYAFCTAHKTKDGFHYWLDYGFMLRDMPAERVENFVRGWKYVVKHTPVSPLRSPAFLADYDSADDRYDGDFIDVNGFGNPHNISEEGQGFLYGCARESGLAAGFALKFDAALALRADETDVIILPSLENVGKDVKDHIRKLYNEGVGLFAVSDVSGLEDIFGVVHDKRKIKISELSDGIEGEFILPMEAELKYSEAGAKVIVSADGYAPVLMKKNRAALINAPVSVLGRDSFIERVQYGRESISIILKNSCKAVLEELSSPQIKAEGCGISAFKDKNGDTILVLFDYSEYDQNKLDTYINNVTVKINLPNVKDVICDKPVNRFYDNGHIKEFKVKLKQHETTVIKLLDIK